MITQLRRISVADSIKIMKLSQTKLPETKDELKKIYIKLAKVYHPDNKTSGEGSKKSFQDL